MRLELQTSQLNIVLNQQGFGAFGKELVAVKMPDLLRPS